MNRLLTTIAVMTVLTAAVVTSAGASESAAAASARSLADRTVRSIARGEMRSVARTMHYPPTYTPEERQKDMSATGDGLDLMAREFGAVTGLKPYTETGMFFEGGGSGGDVPDLASISPIHSTQFLYKATFAKRGDGCIRIMVIQLTPGSPYEFLGVYFGLPATDPHSKTALVDLTRKEFIQMHVPITPDVERQIKESLKPVRYPS